MNCRGCDYRLWNLASRQCPECGMPFQPSSYEFAPNSVQFLCPHCRQAYYGTGPRGHLEPSAFNCVKCGAFITMNDTLLLPADGVVEEATTPLRVPWLDRVKLGRFRAWSATAKMALSRPGKLMEALPESYPAGAAVWYSMLTNFVIYAVTIGLWMSIPMLAFGFGSGRFWRMGVGVFAIVCAVGFATLATAVWMVVWGLISHGVLRVIDRPRFGLGRTLQAVCFSSGANVVTAVPCLGLYVGWIAWIVSAVLMVKEAQRVSGVKATIAVAGPPFVSTVVAMAIYMAFFVQMIANGPTWTTRPAGPGQPGSAIQTALVQYALMHNGKFPAHIGSLLWEGHLLPGDVVTSGGDARASRIAFGDVSINELEAMPLEARRARRDAALAALPTTQPVYRLGDYVFVHAGVSLFSGDVAWLAIAWPAGRTANDLTPVWVVPSIGKIIQVPIADFQARLARQNSIRAQRGLPPIPDPGKIGAATSQNAESADE